MYILSVDPRVDGGWPCGVWTYPKWGQLGEKYCTDPGIHEWASDWIMTSFNGHNRPVLDPLC